jgi:hypothetical protein
MHTYISSIYRYHHKNWSLFSTVACRPPFSAIGQNSTLNGPWKRRCYKVVVVCARKTRWRVLAVRAMVVQCATIGRSQQPLHNMPWDNSKLDAGLWQNPLDLDNRFLHRLMRYCTDRSCEIGDYKWKKVFATISLGLMIYHSMVLSQPPSRNTVPLHVS